VNVIEENSIVVYVRVALDCRTGSCTRVFPGRRPRRRRSLRRGRTVDSRHGRRYGISQYTFYRVVQKVAIFFFCCTFKICSQIEDGDDSAVVEIATRLQFDRRATMRQQIQ